MNAFEIIREDFGPDENGIRTYIYHKILIMSGSDENSLIKGIKLLYGGE